jgi:3-oxoacyl-[acyl-carrier-protein] synthase-1
MEHPDMSDKVGEPIRVAMAPWLDVKHTGAARFESLLFPTIDQVLKPLDRQEGRITVALALALPSERPSLSADLEPRLRSRVNDVFRNRFKAVATFRVGHAGGLLGLKAAKLKLDAGAYDACVIAGVDSYVEAATLGWLEANDQIHGAGPLNNAWGFIPGEGAGAALLLSRDALQRLDAEPLARVLSVGSSFERNRIKTQTVCIGEGLTAAFREGLTGLPPGTKVTDVYCDLNGEPYRADEFGFACLRTKEAFESASDFIAPADCWGDVSAASAPLALVLAVIASQKSYSNGPYAFVWASSETGERAAALLALPVDERR